MTETATTIPRFLERLAEEHADRTAIVLDVHRLSFSDLDNRSATLARGLLSLGVGKGGRVAIWMPNGPEWLVAWLAVGRIGALAVPLNLSTTAGALLASSRSVASDHMTTSRTQYLKG